MIKLMIACCNRRSNKKQPLFAIVLVLFAWLFTLTAAFAITPMEEAPIEVTDQELEAAYEVYVQNFTGKEFLVRHILVSTENEALSALKRVKEGETFGRVASAISIDPGSNNQSGELGWVFPVMFDQEFANGFTSLSPGAISPTPVKTRYGWHIIELVDLRAVEIRSFESVKKPLTDAIRKRKSRTNANAPTLEDANTAFNQGDYETAFKLYTPLAEKGVKGAQMNLGLLHFKNNSRFSNTEKAIYWFTKAAEQRHPVAQMILGEMYVLGNGVERDYFQAADWLYRAAEQGEARAQYYLGLLYWDGAGVSRTPENAVKWLQRAAEQNYIPAYVSLGDAYRLGNGVSQSRDQAFQMYKKGADQGDPDSILGLGYLLLTEHPIEPKAAIKWLTRPEVKNNARAGFYLGLFYASDDTAYQDYKKATHWFSKSAELGNAVAQLNLGIIYQFGHGTAIDYKKAHAWYLKAAKQGNTDAQNNLSVLYSEGKGIKRDYVKAQMWENISFGNGVENTFRDSYASKLSSQQKGQVEKMIAKCLASKYQQCE
jgi:uncharacterized protein